jgi:hypothetical protein
MLFSVWAVLGKESRWKRVTAKYTKYIYTKKGDEVTKGNDIVKERVSQLVVQS